jgi:hypothetical protein
LVHLAGLTVFAVVQSYQDTIATWGLLKQCGQMRQQDPQIMIIIR